VHFFIVQKKKTNKRVIIRNACGVTFGRLR
jgi:hypothetical protein